MLACEIGHFLQRGEGLLEAHLIEGELSRSESCGEGGNRKLDLFSRERAKRHHGCHRTSVIQLERTVLAGVPAVGDMYITWYDRPSTALQ